MKKLSIRQFQRNFYKELKGVPFIVTKQDPHTREDKPEYVVTAYGETPTSQTEEQQPQPTPVQQNESSQESIPEKPSFLKGLFGKK